MDNIIPLYNSNLLKDMYHNGKIVMENIFPNNTNKIVKVNILCRPAEAMLETGENLSHNKNIFCS